MLDNKFLDKVCDQIVSETRVIDNKVHLPFILPFHLLPLSPFHPSSSLFLSYPSSSLLPFFIRHCMSVYSLNDNEIEYVWGRYKEEIVPIMDKKELC
jgi:hypothetical protein